MGDKEKSGVNLCNLVVAKFHKDEKAQTIALGFVIIMGILLAATILLLSTEIPKQTKILEAEHAAKVPQDFAELGAAVDSVALGGDETASATCAIGLTSKSIPFVGVHASGGTLRFDNSSERFECLACSPGEDIHTGSGYWSSTHNNFSYYDNFHVSISDTSNGAELELVTLQDKTYDSGDDVYLAGEYWYNNFTVTGGTTLRTSLLTIHAMNITIDLGSSINASGGGMTGGKKDQDGQGPGRGNNSITNYSAGGGGGGYGGLGGDGGFSHYGTGGQGGSSYGNVTNKSVDAGSGGAGGSCGHEVEGGRYDGGNGGSGGGTIHLDAKTVIIVGILSVNGEAGAGGSWAPDSAGGGGGGGSGGSVFIEGYNVSIHGNIYAKGGAGGDGRSSWDEYDLSPENNGGGGGGGAGGRIKVFYNNTFDASGGLANHVDDLGGAEGKAENAWWSSGVDGGDGYPGTPGTNNSTQVAYNITTPRYSTGYIISNVTAVKGHTGHDAGEVNDTSMLRYGAITWTETTPSGTGIFMKVRTSADANMTGAMDWQDCPEVANGTPISDLPSVSDGHRYIQWRADLYTLERSRTPIIHSVNISYEYGLPVVADCKGSIEFSSHYFSLPNYILVYEHGATIKNQTVGGEIMLHPPPITINKYDNTTSLKISAVNLTGDGDTAGGVFSSAIKASYERSVLLKGGLSYNNITLKITSAYPTAWSRWINKTCEGAGLQRGNNPGNYNISETGNPLWIIFYGNDTHLVNLWLKESKVGVVVEG